MSACPYCATPNEQDFNFCIECEQQIKCTSCRRELIKDKGKCLQCGTFINPVVEQKGEMNTFSLEENQTADTYSRKISFAFTNDGVDKVASVLVGQVPLQFSAGRGLNQRQLSQSNQTAQASTLVSQNEFVDAISDQPATTTPINEGKPTTELKPNDPKNIFEANAKGILISQWTDYKGQTKKEQQERFCLLYVWAYNLLYSDVKLTKGNILDAAKSNGVYDRNLSHYLTKICSDSFMHLDGGYKLKPVMRGRVETIITEVLDSSISGFDLAATGARSGNRAPRANKEGENLIKGWINIPSSLEKFDIKSLSKVADFALFAIYDITKEIGEVASVKPTIAFAYLEKRYKTIPISKEKFRKIVSAKSYVTLFSKAPDGSYFLTSKGEEKAKKLLEL